jgi:hypothetical protein
LAFNRPVNSLTCAGRYVVAYAATEPIAEHLLSWATDAWADAVYDIVQPENAMWPDIEVALIVFEDASCLFYRCAAPPREATLSDGLRGIGRLDRDAIVALLQTGSYLIRVAAIVAVAELEL